MVGRLREREREREKGSLLKNVQCVAIDIVLALVHACLLMSQVSTGLNFGGSGGLVGGGGPRRSEEAPKHKK